MHSVILTKATKTIQFVLLCVIKKSKEVWSELSDNIGFFRAPRLRFLCVFLARYGHYRSFTSSQQRQKLCGFGKVENERRPNFTQPLKHNKNKDKDTRTVPTTTPGKTLMNNQEKNLLSCEVDRQTTSDSKDLSITRLDNIKGIQFHKVLGGYLGETTTTTTLQSHIDSTQPQTLRLGRPDWQALYTQFQADHVLGTVPYRWERDYDEAILIRAEIISNVNILVMQGDFLHSGDLSGSEKAATIKQQLHFEEPHSSPLMTTLGRQGMAACVKETNDEWELILPHNLLSQLNIQERVVARFRRHKAFPITAEGAPWQRYDESSPPELPSLSIDWLSLDENVDR